MDEETMQDAINVISNLVNEEIRKQLSPTQIEPVEKGLRLDCPDGFLQENYSWLISNENLKYLKGHYVHGEELSDINISRMLERFE